MTDEDYMVDKDVWQSEGKIMVKVKDFKSGEALDTLEVDTEEIADGRFDIEVEGAGERR